MQTITAEQFSRIDLGRRGENFARQVVFDLAPWRELYGENGRASLLAEIPEQSTPYPCSTTLDGDRLIWQISAADTSIAGKGRCELSYYIDDRLVKSAIFQTFIADSLAEPGVAPEPYSYWVDNVFKAKNEAIDAKEAIENMSVSVTTLPEDSTASVTKSATTDGFHLTFGIPRGKSGTSGTTPVRGVDYMNEDDYKDFDAHIDERLGEIEDSLNAILVIQDELIGGGAV